MIYKIFFANAWKKVFQSRFSEYPPPKGVALALFTLTGGPQIWWSFVKEQPLLSLTGSTRGGDIFMPCLGFEPSPKFVGVCSNYQTLWAAFHSIYQCLFCCPLNIPHLIMLQLSYLFILMHYYLLNITNNKFLMTIVYFCKK